MSRFSQEEQLAQNIFYQYSSDQNCLEGEELRGAFQMIAYQFQVNLDVDLLMQYANDELPTWPNIEMWFEILDYIEENLEDVCIGGAGAAYQHMEASLDADIARVAGTIAGSLV